MGPRGIREVSGSAVTDAGPGLVVAHGAAVGPIGGARGPAPAVAQGALDPASTVGRAVGAWPASGTAGRPCGPEVA